MLERLTPYLRPPVFPDDEDKTFTASLLHVILWSVLVGICLYTFIATVLSLIQPDMLLVAWLYVLALVTLTLTSMAVMRRGYVQRAAISINIGLWIILTIAAYFNGGVIAPAYSGYLIVITCTCLLVSWQWGIVTVIASSLAGAVFLLAATNNWLPDWVPTYSLEAVWIANVAYFLIITMLLTLALRTIKRAVQQTRLEMAERLKTEQALSNSEQRFRAIFDSVNDAIFVQDLADGRILDVNQKMCERYGYSVEEARQLTIEDLSSGIPPYSQQDAIGWWQKAANGESSIFEWQAKDRAGCFFWVEVNMRRATIDGQARLLVVVRDIDERKRTEAALRREQAYYEAIVNATPVMLWLKDTENRLLHLNPAAAKFEDADVADVEGKSCYELYPRAQAEAYFQDDLEVIQSGQSKLGIVEQHTSVGTGRMMWVETGKVPVRDEQGNLVGVLACSIDITARKEAEQVQAATRQIAEAAAMTQNLEEFYQAVHATISPLIPANNFYITLYDAVNDLFSTPYLIDAFDREWLPYRPGQGLGAYVLRTGEPLLATPEVFAEMKQQGKVEVINRPMVEWLGVPLRTPQGLLGVMAVQNYSGPARLNEKHKDLLMFVSAQVAMAIERKRAEERERRVSQGLRAVIEATQELMNCADLDTLYRRSVELAREKLGLERCGLHLLDKDQQHLLGTYGTDEHGQTADERDARVAVTERDEVFTVPDRLWNVLHKPFNYLRDGVVQVLPQSGWIAATPIRSRHHNIGVLYNDAALTHVSLDETLQEVVAVYGSLLGSLIELKRAEADLAHERDWLQLLMDNFPDTIYFKDTASRFTRINQSQARLLGVTTVEEAIGKTDADFFQSDELAHSFLAEEQQLMSRGVPIIDRVEYNPTPAGQPRWLSASKVPLRDASGQIVGLVGISRDITDRMLAEQRDLTISQGLRAVIESADDLIGCADLDILYRRAVELAREKLKIERCGLFVLDAQGILHGAYGTDLQGKTSDERGAHYQPAADEWLNTSTSLWTISETQQAYWEGDQPRVVGAGWVGATAIRPRDRVMGVLYNDTAITHAPVDEAQQEVLAVYCSLLGSLIELKNAERDRQESERLYRRAIEAVGAVPYYMDYTTESYRFVGEGIQAMTGLLPSEMRPASWNALILEAYPLGQAHDLSHLEAVQETRAGHITDWRCDYRIRQQDGLERWITDASIQVVDEQGQPRGAIGILQDITARKQVELALRESEATTRALLEAIPDAFFRFDAHGIFKEYIPSKDFDSLLPPSEFIGQPYAAVLPPVIVAQLDLNFRQVLEQDELRSYEYPLQIGEQMRYFEARLVKMTQGDVLGMVRDVTDRKQAELALQQREAYLRSIFDNFPYWVWLKDTEGRYLAANRTLAHSLGFENIEALIGKTDWDTTPTVAAKYRADDQAVMDGRIQKFMEEIVIDHGEERWFETFKSPIFDVRGQVIGTTGFAHDVTARRQAEAAIRESEALFRQLADNAPALIALSDDAGAATYLNRGWREFRGDVPNLPLADWSAQVHPADRDRYLHEFRLTLQIHRRFTIEYRLRRADGEYRWLLDTVVPRYAADERFAGLIGIAIDITDRKNAEEALRRSEAQLRLLTQNMVDTISQVDAEYHVLYVSPSIERVLGFRPAELLGQRLLDALHPDDGRTFYHQMIMAATLRASTLRLVYRQRHAAGHYLWMESEIQLLYEKTGEFAGAVFGSRDVSTRQQAEAEREGLIKELEEKNTELERFTYTVSHDLKSPLITIRGFLGFLEKDAVSGNLDRLRADISRIADATTRMQRLLDELLSLSRVGRISSTPQAIAFDALAREAVELVQGRIMARGVRVEIADNLPTIYGDHARLVEVLQNLIDNAVKFMGDRPDPQITIGALGGDQEGLPIFFVQDNGIGIDPNYHERVFGLFNKLDAQSEGTGVGLALVKRIIEVHGGHIWVESDGIGHGTTFLFTLPQTGKALSTKE